MTKEELNKANEIDKEIETLKSIIVQISSHLNVRLDPLDRATIYLEDILPIFHSELVVHIKKALNLRLEQLNNEFIELGTK